MRKSSFTVGFAIAILAIATCQTYAGGLRTQLGEVVIENLQIGQTYNLKQLANLSLVVTNTSLSSVDLQVDIVSPKSDELKMGASAIPDISWITLSENRFKLRSYGNAVSDITISIPKDEQHLGQKYQVTLWSHTLGTDGGGMSLAFGLNSRLIFTIDTTVVDDDYTPPVSTSSAGFVLDPGEIFLTDVEAGKEYDVTENTGQFLKITNSGENKQAFALKSRSTSNSLSALSKGYEDPPDASYLKFSEDEFVLLPGETMTIHVYLDFPKEPEFSGKKYMFVIHAYNADEQVVSGVYSRLYASIK